MGVRLKKERKQEKRNKIEKTFKDKIRAQWRPGGGVSGLDCQVPFYKDLPNTLFAD